MGAVAGARRTLASPAVFTASADPFRFAVGTGVYLLTAPRATTRPGQHLARLPDVTRTGPPPGSIWWR